MEYVRRLLWSSILVLIFNGGIKMKLINLTAHIVAAVPERVDLLIPGPLVRGDNGQPIGCNGLSVL